MHTILALLFVVTVDLAVDAQTIYSIGVYSMGETFEHDWTVGNGNMRFGFDQYLQNQDANGRDVAYAFSKRRTRFTTLFFGPVHFRVRGPAWPATALSGVILAYLFYLLYAELTTTGRDQT